MRDENLEKLLENQVEACLSAAASTNAAPLEISNASSVDPSVMLTLVNLLLRLITSVCHGAVVR